MADDAVAVDTQLAGSIRNANPAGGTRNCGNCVIAVDAILSGRPASALPGGPTTAAELAQALGGKGFCPSRRASSDRKTAIDSWQRL